LSPGQSESCSIPLNAKPHIGKQELFIFRQYTTQDTTCALWEADGLNSLAVEATLSFEMQNGNIFKTMELGKTISIHLGFYIQLHIEYTVCEGNYIRFVCQ